MYMSPYPTVICSMDILNGVVWPDDVLLVWLLSYSFHDPLKDRRHLTNGIREETKAVLTV